MKYQQHKSSRSSQLMAFSSLRGGRYPLVLMATQSRRGESRVREPDNTPHFIFKNSILFGLYTTPNYYKVVELEIRFPMVPLLTKSDRTNSGNQNLKVSARIHNSALASNSHAHRQITLANRSRLRTDHAHRRWSSLVHQPAIAQTDRAPSNTGEQDQLTPELTSNSAHDRYEGHKQLSQNLFFAINLRLSRSCQTIRVQMLAGFTTEESKADTVEDQGLKRVNRIFGGITKEFGQKRRSSLQSTYLLEETEISNADVSIYVEEAGGSTRDVIITITRAVGTITEAVGTITEAVGTITEAVGTITEAVGTITEAVGTITEAVGTITEAVGTITEAVGTITEAVGTITEAVGTITEAVGTITEAVGTITEAVGTITRAVGIVQLGALHGNGKKRRISLDKRRTVLESNLRLYSNRGYIFEKNAIEEGS
ncbi:hypothetical protein F511_41209 [Dorcoceras hygrometricum]|uniref:Uncharacterized protein n=1 Tax=Dorcoceras hygrometricum TaxID=472368 RepID=A0A2Z7APU6_9LAMI|nr:hypothetical protein F511_41209 [Dorcoceras hygrometricum]